MGEKRKITLQYYKITVGFLPHFYCTFFTDPMDFLSYKAFLVQLLANKPHYIVTFIAGCYGVSKGQELVLHEVSEIQGMKVLDNNNEILYYKAQSLMFC